MNAAWPLCNRLENSVESYCKGFGIAMNAIAVQLSCNRHECLVNAVQSLCNRCRPPWRSHGDLTMDSLRCHEVLGDCTALSRWLHGVPTAFFKGRRSHGICNLQQNTNAVPRCSRRFHGVLCRCRRSGDDPDRRENTALVWQGFKSRKH
jgi:hypothetical protein